MEFGKAICMGLVACLGGREGKEGGRLVYWRWWGKGRRKA